MTNPRKFYSLVTLANEMAKAASSQLEKDTLNTLFSSPLLVNQKFPVSDTYVYYKKQEEKSKEEVLPEEIEKVSLKLYLAGYTKEDITVAEDPANNSIVVSGDVQSGNEHFPNQEEAIRQTQNASSRKFKVRYGMLPRFKLDSVKMKDGVLSIDFTPIEDLKVKKIEIE